MKMKFPKSFHFIFRFVFILHTAHISIVTCRDKDTREKDSTVSEVIENFREFIQSNFSPHILSAFQNEDKNINYLFYSRDNPTKPCDLQPTKSALKRCSFKVNRETKIIVHGWITEMLPSSPFLVMKDKYLQHGDYNVVIFNWTLHTNTMYFTAVEKTPLISLKMAAWISFLKKEVGADPGTFHFISHSLGSQMVSFAAKITCGIGSITYLDPAGPTFRDLPWYLKPTYIDAYFVETIHTNGGTNDYEGYSLIESLAHIDYYPNGGSLQPKCYSGASFKYPYGGIGIVNSHASKNSCSHDSVLDYFIASFEKGCLFKGVVCDSYDDFKDGKCKYGKTAGCKMGFNSKRYSKLEPLSKCYLETSAKEPYCLP